MKSTDVVQDPPVDPYWLDVPAAARYLCMTPHAIFIASTAATSRSSGRGGWFAPIATSSIGGCERWHVMALLKRGDVWYFTKRINGQRFRVSTGFADRKSVERRAAEIEVDIRSGIHGWKSTMPSFAESQSHRGEMGTTGGERVGLG